MDKFRAENRIVLNDELSDLNATTVEVIALQQRIKAIEKKGDELLATIPDNGVICATQVRYRIGILILERMSELVDNCVSIHLDADNSPNLNVIGVCFQRMCAQQCVIDCSIVLQANQIGCINETLISADRDVDAMKVNVEECKLFIWARSE